MIAEVLTTCHTQYNWDSSIYLFLFNRTTLQVFVIYLTGALYVHRLWFHKHQHDNRVRSSQNAFSLPFAAILVNCAPSGEMHNYCTPHIIKENSENFLIHRCNYILLSEVYCVWQVVKTPTIILNNPVFCSGVGIATRLWTGRSGVQILVGQVVILSFEKSRSTLAPPTSYSVGTGVKSQRSNDRGVKLITKFHLVPRLRRMSGAETPLPLHAFLARIGITFTHLFSLVHCHYYGWLLHIVPHPA